MMRRTVGREVPPAVTAAVRAAVQQGQRAPQIARECGVSVSYVHKIEHELGVWHTPGPTPEHPWRTYGGRLRYRTGRHSEEPAP